jgi:hypothetical protein
VTRGWWAAAACADADAALFHPTTAGAYPVVALQRAAAYCAGCPVVEECEREGFAPSPSARRGIYGGWLHLDAASNAPRDLLHELGYRGSRRPIPEYAVMPRPKTGGTQRKEHAE